MKILKNIFFPLSGHSSIENRPSLHFALTTEHIEVAPAIIAVTLQAIQNITALFQANMETPFSF